MHTIINNMYIIAYQYLCILVKSILAIKQNLTK